MDDVAAYRPLHARYLELVRKHYGELHPLYIDGLVADANRAILSGDTDTASGTLNLADTLIRRAGLDHSRERALWWEGRATLLRGQAVSSPERIAALEAAIRLFPEVAPTDIIYASALSALGGVRYRAGDDQAAETLYRTATDVVIRGFGPEYGELAPLYTNLGSVASEAGDFVSATSAYERSAAIALKTYGPQSRQYLAANTEYALLLHQRGERKRALDLFTALYNAVPTGRSYVDAESTEIAAVVRENYGYCLLAEGRAGLAAPLLKEALRIFSLIPLYSDFKQSFSVHIALGDAYAATGRAADAQIELQSTLKALGLAKKGDDPLLLRARERWGHFLQQHGDMRGAAQQYNEILTQAHGRSLTSVANAYADLAQLALTRRDTAQASQLSERAVTMADSTWAEPDVRFAPRIWRIRAAALVLSGDADGAERWARRALEAARRYDDPASPDVAAAEDTLRATLQFAAAR